ncbi:MAG: hypothetical protein HFH85_15295 [Lachnospiraceae bacterium]|jgi:hypothetical protein|nr:hypothetical protein [Lachnospiraceae bacterium]
MNKNYKNKKCAAIIILSVLAVCLAVGLVWYVGRMGKAEFPLEEPEVAKPETAVTVQEADEGATMGPKAGPGQEPKQETGQGAVQEETHSGVAEPLEGENCGEDGAGLAETEPAGADESRQLPEDAASAEEPPAEADSNAVVEGSDMGGNCQPEQAPPQESQPQGGDANPAGAVYVPGFGYIESSGPNRQETSRAEGDWDKQIGTMQ